MISFTIAKHWSARRKANAENDGQLCKYRRIPFDGNERKISFALGCWRSSLQATATRSKAKRKGDAKTDQSVLRKQGRILLTARNWLRERVLTIICVGKSEKRAKGKEEAKQSIAVKQTWAYPPCNTQNANISSRMDLIDCLSAWAIHQG